MGGWGGGCFSFSTCNQVRVGGGVGSQMYKCISGRKLMGVDWPQRGGGGGGRRVEWTDDGPVSADPLEDRSGSG